MFENYNETDSLGLIIKETKALLEEEKYITALICCLCIPDILGSVGKTKSTRASYIKWFDACVKNEFGLTNDDLSEDFKFSHIGGDICYKLRCSLLHAGDTSGIKKDGIVIDEFVLVCNKERFVRGDVSGYKYDYNRLIYKDNGYEVIPNSQYLYISVYGLCMEILEGAEEFLRIKQNELKTPKIKIGKYGGKISKNLFIK